MYAIHTTPGFIIGSRPNGEASKLLSIFTSDLGLVRAIATGIRLEKSKLRPFMQEYSFGTFSFVRGKEFWRLTSAQEGGAPKSLTSGKSSHELLVRVASLLERLLQGEDPHPELFQCIETTASFIENSLKLNEEEISTLESLVVMRILGHLGYVGDSKDFNEILASNNFDIDLLKQLKGKRTAINLLINKALRESHL